MESEREELTRREAIYRGGRPPLDVRGKIVILIDDGLATGSTMRAAVAALRQKEPARIVVAVPVGAASTCAEFQSIADECVCAIAPENFRAVGLWYDDFAQTVDEEVCIILTRAGQGEDIDQDERRMSSDSFIEREVAIVAGDKVVRGTLIAAGRGRRGRGIRPRKRERPIQPAQPVRRASAPSRPAWRRCLVDLLEEQRPATAPVSLTFRSWPAGCESVARWLSAQPETAPMRLGYFGASTGAGAALLAAANQGDSVGAIVSRGGRPDLARDVLSRVTAPTRLIVGGNDEIVIELNREAYDLLNVRDSSTSSPVPRTCLPSQGRSKKSPGWPGNGFSVTWNAIFPTEDLCRVA